MRQAPPLLLIALSAGCGPANSPPPHVGKTEMRATSSAALATPAAELFARAEHLIDCANLAEASLNDTRPLPPSAPPLPVEAEPEPMATSQRRRDCAGLGPGARAMAHQLLAQAATNGDADARIALLDQDADSLLETVAARASTDGKTSMTSAERAQTEAITAALEQQAFQGNRRAIESLQQLLDSSVSALVEPGYAAAWRLAAAQPPGRALAPGPLRGEEMLENLDTETQQRVVALARDLHAACCAR